MSAPLKFFDRAVETCQAPGVGPVTLLGAQTGYQSIFDLLNPGDRCMLLIRDQPGSGVRWEIVEATLLNDGTFSRQAGDVEDSSAGPGSLVDFDSGTQDVWLCFTAALARQALYGETHAVSPAAAIWTINHDLGTHPIVICEDDTGLVMAPQSIRYASYSQVVITFGSAKAGMVTLR